jgi:outer membrane lipopolysaccharide assembly protein LptE/RlpB
LNMNIEKTLKKMEWYIKNMYNKITQIQKKYLEDLAKIRN